MNKFTFDSSWNQIKGKLRQKYGQLTDDDLEFAQGKGEELLGRLQSRLGIGADQLNKMLHNFKSEVEEAAGTVQGRFETAKHKVSDIAHDVKARMTEAAEDLNTRAAETADQLKEKAGEIYGDVRYRVRSWHEECEDYVREQPRTALLTALAAGFMVGLLVRR